MKTYIYTNISIERMKKNELCRKLIFNGNIEFIPRVGDHITILLQTEKILFVNYDIIDNFIEIYIDNIDEENQYKEVDFY